MKTLTLTATMAAAVLLALPAHADQVQCQARTADAERTAAQCADASTALKLRLRQFGTRHYGGNLSDKEWDFLKRNPPSDQRTEIEAMAGDERRVGECHQRAHQQQVGANNACADATRRQSPQLAAIVSANEIEGVRNKIRPCWNTIGGPGAIVQFKVEMNPDGTVMKASVVDGQRYASDPAFRAAADAGHRAITNPRCQPWPLSPKKYNAWKSFVLNFDPRDY